MIKFLRTLAIFGIGIFLGIMIQQSRVSEMQKSVTTLESQLHKTKHDAAELVKDISPPVVEGVPPVK